VDLVIHIYVANFRAGEHVLVKIQRGGAQPVQNIVNLNILARRIAGK
jgi:hypothetical protein